MSSQRYTDEFKTEAVKQITESGHTVPEVAKRLGVTTNSLYKWFKRELKRVTEERDILRKAAYFAKQSG